MNLLLRNATYIDWKTLDFSVKNIIVRPGDDTIQLISRDDDGIVYPDTEVIDCAGKLGDKIVCRGAPSCLLGPGKRDGCSEEDPAQLP